MTDGEFLADLETRIMEQWTGAETLRLYLLAKRSIVNYSSRAGALRRRSVRQVYIEDAKIQLILEVEDRILSSSNKRHSDD